MIKLPGLIDPHVHLRQPGAEHKETWDTGTSAALAGGFTTVLVMPNTNPAVTGAASLELVDSLARANSRCDYALFLGAGPSNASETAMLAPRAAGLKLYLDQTYGALKLDDMTLWQPHFEQFPAGMPLAVHAEGRTLAAAILFASLCNRPVHICHVSTREEILLIRRAREKGLPVTCEVTPHHLFLSSADLQRIGAKRGEVRPRLASPGDVQALWDNLDVIDCFATDHAPHTLAEKDSLTPPPGFPGLETCLPLLLTAVHAGRLTLEDIILRCHTNPRRIFNLPEQPDTWVELDPDAEDEIHAAHHFSRCGWTPFEGIPVRGRINRVVLRGKPAFENGTVIALPGSGLNCRN